MTTNLITDHSVTRDVFISHASEDKETVARPLAISSADLNITYWFDQQEILIGDNIRQKIDEGIRSSRFGVIILSPDFLAKGWTNYELDGLTNLQMTQNGTLLPVWHNITRVQIAAYSLSLAGIASMSTSDYSVPQIATAIARKIRSGDPTPTNSQSSPRKSSIPTQGFAVCYIAEASTPELNPQEHPENNIWPTGATGWLPMLANNDEIEFRIDNDKVRLRVSWNLTFSGGEFQAAMLASNSKASALILRPTEGGQIYFPSLTSPATSALTSRSGHTGWLTFRMR